MLFEGVAHGSPSFVKFVQDTDRDRESLLCLRLFDQSQYCLERITQDPMTGSGHVAEQTAFDRVELRAIRGIVGHTDRYRQVVHNLLEVCLAQMRVTTVPATAIAQEQDR